MKENEKQIGTIHVGFGQMVTYYDLIFTTSRIIFAKTGRWAIWALLLGPVGMLMALSQRNKMQRELLDKSLENILSLSEDNYFVPYSDLKSIQIIKGFGGIKLEIITIKDKKSFKFFGLKTAVANKAQISEYENIIKNAVPDKFIQ
jgi:hypothetical protein